MSTTTATDFTSGELVAIALDALLNAAAGHLGEHLPDGRLIDEPAPVQAWLALTAAAALLDDLGPLMRDEAIIPFQAGFTRLTQAFARAYPGWQSPDERPAPITFQQSAAAIAALLAE